MKTKIVISVSGGVVQEVCTNNSDVVVRVVDADDLECLDLDPEAVWEEATKGLKPVEEWIS